MASSAMPGPGRSPGMIDVTGSPMKSRSFDGFQFQYRYALVEVTCPFPSFHSALTEVPPRS